MKPVWILPFVAVLLAGCGGGRPATLTVPGYGPYPAQTITAGPASQAECAQDARIFTRDALALLAHSSSSAAYPADLYYSILREDFADFEARRCDPNVLGPPLRSGLTAKQRAALIADLPSVMAQVVRDGLGGT